MKSIILTLGYRSKFLDGNICPKNQRFGHLFAAVAKGSRSVYEI